MAKRSCRVSKINKSQAQNQGMTLIEILVAMGVFSVVVISAVAIFNSAIQMQRRALMSQELLDQASYVMEYMSRSLRMAKKDLGPNCLSSYGLNYEIIGGGSNEGTHLKFINHLKNDECQEIYLDVTTNRIKHITNDGTFFLTSSGLYVEDLRFFLSGKDQTDTIQPRVTIFLDVRAREGNAPIMKIQTTISNRNLDFEY